MLSRSDEIKKSIEISLNMDILREILSNNEKEEMIHNFIRNESSITANRSIASKRRSTSHISNSYCKK